MIGTILFPNIHAGSVASVLREIDPTLVIRRRNDLIRLGVERAASTKLFAGKFLLVRLSFQVENEQSLFDLGDKVQKPVVVHDTFSIGIVRPCRMSSLIFVGRPFEPRSIQDVEIRRPTVLVQRVPIVAMGLETAKRSVLGVFSYEEFRTLGVPIVASLLCVV